jgi:hypothetical protein
MGRRQRPAERRPAGRDLERNGRARLVEPLPPQAEIEEIYEQIRPTLGAEAEERMRRLRERPIRFDRIITPRFDCSPGQDIRSLLAASPSIKELLETGGPLR